MYDTEIRELRDQIARLEIKRETLNKQLWANSDRFVQAVIKRDITEIEGQITRLKERLREIEEQVTRKRREEEISRAQKTETERWMRYFDGQVRTILDRYGRAHFGLRGNKYQVTGGIIETSYGECKWEVRWGLNASYSSSSYSSISVTLLLDSQGNPKAFQISGIKGGTIETSPRIASLEDGLVNTEPYIHTRYENESYSSPSDSTPCCC